jgi:hypothetical protein
MSALPENRLNYRRQPDHPRRTYGVNHLGGAGAMWRGQGDLAHGGAGRG